MLEIRNLAFQYSPNDDSVIRDVSFVANPGEITSIIGANGVGKTTMLKCIVGLQSGAKGLVKINGQDRNGMTLAQISEHIGYMSQNTACDANLNVYEIVLLGLLNQLSFRVSEEDTAKVDAVMKLMNISHLAHRKISELSGGQRQLVFIAQTLIKDPQIIVMDEPTSALDLNKQFQLMDFLKKITQEKQFTTLLTLHHLDLAARYADKVVVVHDGVVYAQGTPQEVFTIQMLRDVYSVDAELFVDKCGNVHVVAVNHI